ncbi:hypothetical protein [Fervidobacterium sp. 2310opik-2]|uniref:hypothetical protein n=1 Tax=Fervidobacterium sp. 2310opik-2 TaxID=1755815 RepID=UPI0013DEB282|nr:hypothetical protein [Fervidobacterium sp. 2310opik-2]KAF2962352.1 hypothetical protein AS161_05305 [Fervidobacterium sp. 2310opik-2]
MGKKLYLGLVIVVLLLIFTIFSCVPNGGTPATNVVTVQTNKHGHLTNIELVYAKDGLNGTWTKLTGSNGIYTFEVKDPDGLYSVVGVDKRYNEASEVIFFNAKLSETNSVFLGPFTATEEDAATITVNLPISYNGKQASVFFLHEHRFPTIESGKLIADGIPKGKADAVIFVGAPWSETGVEKIAIIRNLEVNSDKTVTLNDSDLKDVEPAEVFQDIYLNWIVGGTSHVFGTRNTNGEFHKIPASLKTSSDLYNFSYGDWVNNFDYYQYQSDYPSSSPFATDTINPTTLSETILSTQTTTDGMRISITPHNANISGLSTTFYLLDVERYKDVSVWGFPIVDVYYKVYISSGYLQAISNNYDFPKISGDFEKFNLKDKYFVQGIVVTSSNGTLKDYFVPKNNLKVLKQW